MSKGLIQYSHADHVLQRKQKVIPAAPGALESEKVVQVGLHARAEVDPQGGLLVDLEQLHLQEPHVQLREDTFVFFVVFCKIRITKKMEGSLTSGKATFLFTLDVVNLTSNCRKRNSFTFRNLTSNCIKETFVFFVVLWKI